MQRFGRIVFRWQLMDVFWLIWWIPLELAPHQIKWIVNGIRTIARKHSFRTSKFVIRQISTMLLHITTIKSKKMARRLSSFVALKSHKLAMEWFGEFFLIIYIFIISIFFTSQRCMHWSFFDSYKCWESFSDISNSQHVLHCIYEWFATFVRSSQWASHSFWWS